MAFFSISKATAQGFIASKTDFIPSFSANSVVTTVCYHCKIWFWVYYSSVLQKTLFHILHRAYKSLSNLESSIDPWCLHVLQQIAHSKYSTLLFYSQMSVHVHTSVHNCPHSLPAAASSGLTKLFSQEMNLQCETLWLPGLNESLLFSYDYYYNLLSPRYTKC